MASVHNGRFSAQLDGDFVVFLIGMRFNKPWKVHTWWPVFTAMPRMLRYLAQRPELGMLGYTMTIGARGPLLVQYWRSFEQLERFAADARAPHHPAWRAFNRSVGASGDVGFWHESYLVGPGRHEAVYVNMPVVGLAAAGTHVPVGRRGDAAAQRLEADAAPHES